MKTRKTTKITAFFLSLVLLLSLIGNVPGFTTKSEASERKLSFTEIKEHFGKDRALAGKKDGNDTENAAFGANEIVRVSIVLDDDSALEKGLIEQYGAASEEVNEYRKTLLEKQNAVADYIKNNLLNGKNFDVIWNLTLVGNALSVDVPYGLLDEIKSIPGVMGAFAEKKYDAAKAEEGDGTKQYLAENMINSNYAWELGYTGAGTRIAVLDTGVNDEHIMFSNEAYLYSLSKNAESKGMTYEEYVESLNLLTVEELTELYPYLNASTLFEEGADASKLYINDKIPVSLNYPEKSYDGSHKTPTTNNHGSHVAGIAAGNKYVEGKEEGTFEEAFDVLYTQGVAPDAQIINMKVFGKSGSTYPSDYFVAIEDALILGADSINLSLGSASAGFASIDNDYYEYILDVITYTGTVVVCSAGNNGAWADQATTKELYLGDINYATGGSPSTYKNTLSVASADNIGSVFKYFEIDGTKISYSEGELPEGCAVFGTLTGDYDFVYIDGVGSEEEFAAVNEKVSLKGKIVLVNRGEISFYVKGNNLLQYEPAALICVNNTDGVINMNIEGYKGKFPFVSVLQSVRTYIIGNANPVSDGQEGTLCYTGKINTKEGYNIELNQDSYYTMSDFSSWGVPSDLSLKPEVTAPGGNIFSVDGSTNDQAVSMSGTSMAAPQTAGAAAILAQYIKENDLEAMTGLTVRQLVTSLLMSTANPVINGESGYYYSVMQQGAGLIDILSALSAKSFILMEEDATDSYMDGKVKVELGADQDRNGTYSFHFTLNNMGGYAQSYQLYADFFTQYPYYNEYLQDAMLSQYCFPLATSIVWTVNGKVLDTSNSDCLNGLDLNDDGCVNSEDAYLLLAYTTDSDIVLKNAESADLDGDMDLDTYDAYLFFKYLYEGIVEIAPYECVEIGCEFTLENIEYFDYNGAYIEGFVYADELDSEEGVEGVTHSIPVFGYYGNYTEASMYDGISYLEERINALNGVIYRYNYLPNYFELNKIQVQSVNTFLYKKYGSAYYWFLGETEQSYDTEYFEFRNAISSKVVKEISGVNYAQIRNSAATRVRIYDTDGNVYYTVYDNTPWNAAFYSESIASWAGTATQFNFKYDISEVPEGTRLIFELASAPEYYINPDFDPETSDESEYIFWDELGEGAFFTQSFTVDNTAPKLETATVDISNSGQEGLIKIKVKDENYISAVLVYGNGELIGYEGANQNIETLPGEEYEFFFDTKGNQYIYVEVYDYANNVRTYKLNMDPSELLDDKELTIYTEDLELFRDQTYILDWEVTPWGIPDESVIWSSSDEDVATVDENGIVTGIGKGSCTITGTLNCDNTVTASISVNVKLLEVTANGVLMDENGDVRKFVRNFADESNWQDDGEIKLESFVSAAYSGYYDHYFIMDESSLLYYVNPETGEADLELEARDNSGILFSDMAVGDGTGILYTIYGSYLLLVGYNSNEYWIGAHVDLSEFNIGSFAAVANAGCVRTGPSSYFDVFYLVTTEGYLFQCLSNGRILYMYGIKTQGNDYMWSYDAIYGVFNSSLTCGDDNALYLSLYNESLGTNQVFRIVPEDGYALSTLVGDFGEDIWPVSITQVTSNQEEEVINREIEYDIIMEFKEIDSTESVADILKGGKADETQSIENTESLGVKAQYDFVKENYVSEKESEVLISTEEVPVINHREPIFVQIAKATHEYRKFVRDLVTKELVKKEVDIFVPESEDGTPVTNGKITVNWDPDEMELYYVDLMFEGYSAFSEEYGELTLSFVSLGGLKPGMKIGKVYLIPKAVAHYDVEITVDEVNTDHVDESNIHCISEHVYTKLVNKKEATCTECGYTGDLVCEYCDKLLIKGLPVKAKGHTYLLGRCIYCKEVKSGSGNSFVTVIKKLLSKFSMFK